VDAKREVCIRQQDQQPKKSQRPTALLLTSGAEISSLILPEARDTP
jgi:hypothetical protein